MHTSTMQMQSCDRSTRAPPQPRRPRFIASSNLIRGLWSMTWTKYVPDSPFHDTQSRAYVCVVDRRMAANESHCCQRGFLLPNHILTFASVIRKESGTNGFRLTIVAPSFKSRNMCSRSWLSTEGKTSLLTSYSSVSASHDLALIWLTTTSALCRRFVTSGLKRKSHS